MGLQTEEFTWNQNIVISNSKMISQRPCLVGVGVSMIFSFCGMIMLSGIAQFQIRINSAVNLSAKGGTQQQWGYLPTMMWCVDKGKLHNKRVLLGIVDTYSCTQIIRWSCWWYHVLPYGNMLIINYTIIIILDGIVHNTIPLLLSYDKIIIIYYPNTFIHGIHYYYPPIPLLTTKCISFWTLYDFAMDIFASGAHLLPMGNCPWNTWKSMAYNVMLPMWIICWLKARVYYFDGYHECLTMIYKYHMNITMNDILYIYIYIIGIPCYTQWLCYWWM